MQKNRMFHVVVFVLLTLTGCLSENRIKEADKKECVSHSISHDEYAGNVLSISNQCDTDLFCRVFDISCSMLGADGLDLKAEKHTRDVAYISFDQNEEVVVFCEEEKSMLPFSCTEALW